MVTATEAIPSNTNHIKKQPASKTAARQIPDQSLEKNIEATNERRNSIAGCCSIANSHGPFKDIQIYRQTLRKCALETRMRCADTAQATLDQCSLIAGSQVVRRGLDTPSNLTSPFLVNSSAPSL